MSVLSFILSSNEHLDENFLSEIFTYEAVEFVRSTDGSSIKVSDWPLSKKVNALAGIGNPKKFFDTLRSLDMSPIEHSFPDHYEFMEEDLHFEENLPIIMTEKDAVRCANIKLKNLWYLKVEVNIPESFIEEVADRIKNTNR